MRVTAEELAALLDSAEAAENLIRWASVNLREIIIPARPWCRASVSGAAVAGVYIKDRSSHVRLVAVKVLPPGARNEPQAHLCAVDDAPLPFRRHLVEPIYDPLLLPSGGVVVFQGLAGRSIAWRPMADLPIRQIPAACEVVAGSLIAEWNPDFGLTPMTAIDFLTAEIVDLDSVRGYIAAAGPAAWSPWLRTDAGPPVPNPLRLLATDSLLAHERLDIITGRVHGDLHGANALMQQKNFDDFDTFVLVDLAAYSASGQLGRDLVTMLLSAIARLLPDLAETQQRCLLDAFVRPDLEPAGQLPPLPVQTLRAVYGRASALLDGYAKESWHCQYLLSLVAHGLNHTTFVHLEPDQRWWFYRLAAYAARELLSELGRSGDAPQDAPHIANTYADDTGVTVSTQADRHAAGLARWPRQPNPGRAR